MNRSDLFIVTINMNVGFMYVVASSCGLEGQVLPPAESRVLHENQQRCKTQRILAPLLN